MSPAGRSLEVLLARAVRRIRAEAATAVVMGAVAVIPVVLLAAWLVGGAWPDRGGAPLVVGVAALLAAVGIAGALARRWLVPVDPVRVAAEAERRRGLPEGSLRAVLELGRNLPAGVSAALFRRSEAEVARGLADATPKELSGELGTGVRRVRLRLLTTTGVLTALAVMAGFVAPDRARAGWTPLLHPVAHLTGPALPPLVVRPGDADVPRGDSVAVVVDAPGRSRVALHWREVGDVPRSRSLEPGSGAARATLGPIDSEVRYWITAPDGAATDTFTLRPVDPLLLRTLVVELTYPVHVGRPPDQLGGDIPPLEVPEGTRLRVRGSATGPLAAVALARADGVTRPLAVEGDGFRGDWRLGPEASGVWSWRARGSGGEAIADVAPLDIRVVADSAPRVRISAPDPEAVMDPSRRQAVLADAEDDHGLRSASLVFRRVSAAGTGPESRVALPVEPGAARLLLRGVLDASGERLVAGDAVEYRVEVTDNSPRRHVGRSATHVLRLAGAGELRDRARSDVAAAQEAAERLAERSRRLRQETHALSRQAAGRSGGGSAGSSAGRSPAEERLGFEAAREAEDVLREHESVLQEAASLRDRLESLERSSEAAGLRDPELQRRLTEMRELFERLATPEVRREMEALREAVEALDPEAVQEALAELAARQETLRETLEQSLALMRRAAAEQELTALAREAEEIAAEQRALAEALAEEAGERPAEGREAGEREAAATAEGGARPGQGEAGRARQDSAAADPTDTKSAGSPAADSAAGQSDAAGRPLSLPRPSLPIPRPRLPTGERAEQQDSLRERAERLNASLSALRPQLLQIGEKETASEAGAAQESGEAAQQSMQDASSQARQQQGAKAAASGRQAAGEMSDAASRLDAARRQMTEAWKREAQQAVRQATQEALDLAQREEALRQAMEQAQQQGSTPGTTTQQLRSEQAALQQGLQQLGRNLSETGRRSGLVSPDVGQALARAMLDMQRTLDGMQDAGGSMPLQQAGQAVESLNQLAMSLLQNDARIERSESGATEQALRQLAQLAQQQASLNAQTAAVPPLELGERALARRLDQLAEQQRGIGRRTGEIGGMLGGREDLLGRLDPLTSEAEALARELEGGRLDPELRARQEQLFRRLLDAGRSLEREEYSDEREGTRAGAVDVEAPAALDPALVDPRLRYAPPTAEQLRSLPPAYRRLILEYFDRLNGRGGGS